ncbi:hypothetical protein BD410DRAFT_712172 [Rickenella mellea]|uniref:Trafficking protein particle complex II-specific subunit 65 IgD3 domain-containing protein n=1 Tax=Rickenella mellea TaxID=50990 RepID=A0A4Y7QMT6_9AGAM|nr:hypothetical protein BD410DRAFT_712172 [Rickenella mellea]
MEQLFTSSSLNLVVPDTTVQLPKDVLTGVEGDLWLAEVDALTQRSQAFFDEKLDFLLILRLGALPVTDSKSTISPVVLTFLQHLQISLEATYISPQSDETPLGGTIGAVPARTPSSSRARQALGANVPLFPPQTPNPTPVTVQSDQKYVNSEGTLLQSFIWGDRAAQTDETDSFAILWSENEQTWSAVYRLSVIVAFVRTNYIDPLLCLTASVTLREKPLSETPPRRALAEIVGSVVYPSMVAEEPSVTDSKVEQEDREEDLAIFEEVNLLSGFQAGPTFASTPDSPDLYLPTSRLGPRTRRDIFPLVPQSPETPSMPTPSTARSVQTLKKSFRKILATVSGFRVRMRTVFVPCLYLQGDEHENEPRQEAGNEERTVVLCVEVENSGESGAGFAVEHVEVSISGEGTKVQLVGWGEHGFSDSTKIFPLLIRSSEQYNLLYAVTFMDPPETHPTMSRRDSGGPSSLNEFQRAVSINVTGRPFEMSNSADIFKDPEHLMYPTSSFLSRWNCVLDLSPPRRRDSSAIYNDPPGSARNVLPTPPSPFPLASPQTKVALEKVLAATKMPPLSMVGSKRHTFAIAGAAPNMRVPVNYRASTSMLGSELISSPTIHGGATPPPSRTVPGKWKSNAPASALSPPLPALPAEAQLSADQQPSFMQLPPTPAYPAYTNAPWTPRPASQAPVSDQQTTAGPSVDIHREHMNQAGVPQTPGPRFPAPSPIEKVVLGSIDVREPVVISVIVVPPHRDFMPTHDSDKIYPLDEFMLELFVFNQSSSVKRFEVSYPDRKRYREDLNSTTRTVKHGFENPGFIPLENRIRIGPLRPSTCQSTRMRFLAMTPGLHSIDTLILTDVETGIATNLRFVPI